MSLSNISSYIEALKRRGFKDEKKLQSMLNKAKELAAKKGKAGDKETILGIFQSFFKEK